MLWGGEKKPAADKEKEIIDQVAGEGQARLRGKLFGGKKGSTSSLKVFTSWKGGGQRGAK